MGPLLAVTSPSLVQIQGKPILQSSAPLSWFCVHCSACCIAPSTLFLQPRNQSATGPVCSEALILRLRFLSLGNVVPVCLSLDLDVKNSSQTLVWVQDSLALC